MPKIKITQDQMLAVYLERILKDKGEWAEDAQEQKRQIERLRQKLDDRVEREMMRVLSDDQLDELERRLDDGMDDDELEEFLGNTGADFGAAARKAMIEFRAEYLGETPEEAERKLQLAGRKEN